MQFLSPVMLKLGRGSDEIEEHSNLRQGLSFDGDFCAQRRLFGEPRDDRSVSEKKAGEENGCWCQLSRGI